MSGSLSRGLLLAVFLLSLNAEAGTISVNFYLFMQSPSLGEFYFCMTRINEDA